MFHRICFQLRRLRPQNYSQHPSTRGASCLQSRGTHPTPAQFPFQRHENACGLQSRGLPRCSKVCESRNCQHMAHVSTSEPGVLHTARRGSREGRGLDTGPQCGAKSGMGLRWDCSVGIRSRKTGIYGAHAVPVRSSERRLHMQLRTLTDRKTAAEPKAQGE